MIDEKVYESIGRVIGRISRFIEDLVRPQVIGKELEAAYKQMAQDEERETEAMEWAEGLVGDATD